MKNPFEIIADPISEAFEAHAKQILNENREDQSTGTHAVITLGNGLSLLRLRADLSKQTKELISHSFWSHFGISAVTEDFSIPSVDPESYSSFKVGDMFFEYWYQEDPLNSGVYLIRTPEFQFKYTLPTAAKYKDNFDNSGAGWVQHSHDTGRNGVGTGISKENSGKASCIITDLESKIFPN